MKVYIKYDFLLSVIDSYEYVIEKKFIRLCNAC